MLDLSRLKAGLTGALAAVLAFAGAVSGPSASAAQAGTTLFQHEKYAAVVVDANTGEVLYARRADEPRYPASITKIMTLYLTFEALATGRLSVNDRIPVSAHAAHQNPSKLGIRPGGSLTVDQAIKAIAVLSANDIAVAVAEKIGGNERKFAELMTLRAKELGMDRTHFANANGLPDPHQISTARDIAILSRAIMRDYPQYYSYFGVKEFQFEGREITNHNHLLGKVEGVDGLKTGYTSAAGFNLAASAKRNGKRLIAVVLGGSSTAARDENVEDLINGGFEVFSRRAQGQNITLASTLHEPADSAAGPVQRPPSEMGSGEQSGLKIVLGDHTGPTPLTLATLPPSLSRPDATAPADAPPGAGTAAARGVAQSTCFKGRGHHRHRVPCAGVATAKASPPCIRTRHGHRAKACPATRNESARNRTDASPPATSSGAYQIQVGVFSSPTAAKAHMASLRGRFHKVLTAAPQVEKAGRGKYRARFAGFDRDDARQACHTLASKGVHCMVVAGS
jgi:D-alanyl-D-alanine carboxypeptidase (penicillin-binding protein 5/6)